jgi:hypothetical protein
MELVGIPLAEGPGRVIAAYALGVLGSLAGALALGRLARRRFDRVVGRPHKPQERIPAGTDPRKMRIRQSKAADRALQTVRE